MMRRRFWVSLGGSFIALALAGQPAFADNKSDAQARQEEGIKRYKAGDAEGARVAFAQAYAIYPSPKILWNLIVAEADSGKALQASRHIHVYMASKDPAITEEKKQVAGKKLEATRKTLGAVQVVAPAGAKVTVDGDSFPQTGYLEGDLIELEPGSHTVVMESGAQKKERAIVVKQGEVTRVAFEEPPPEPPPVAQVPVKPPPVEPPPEPPPDTGSSGGGLACPHSGACIGTTVALAVVGLAGGVGALVFNSSASSAVDDANKLTAPGGPCAAGSNACGSQLKDAEDKHSNRLTLARASLGVGIAGLAAAGVVFFVWPKSHKEPAAQLTPMVSPHTAGFGLTGRF